MATTYQMTPADRRELARLRREEQLGRLNTLKQMNATRGAVVEAQQKQPTPETAAPEKEDASFLKRAYATTRDIDDQFGFGLAKSIEGLVDIGISVVGAIGGIFDEDFKEQMKRNVEHDFVKENFENSEFAQSARQYSYLGEDAASNMVRQTSRAVGGMLPAIGVSTLTGNPALGIAMMSGGAAGQSTEEAYKEGAGYYEGLGYGVASGLVEAGTEMLFSGVTKKVLGPGLVNKAAKSAGKEVAETGVKRIVKGMAEEAAEEAVAEAVSPLTKTIYKGTDALEEYKDPEFYKGIGESALVGAAAGGVVGAMTGNMSIFADVQASMESLQKLDKMESDYFNKDVLSEDVQGKINASRLANLENIQTALSKMSASKRADTIKNYGLSETFAEDGKLRPEARASLSGEQLTTDGENSSQSESVAVDKRYLSPSLWNHAKAVEEDLETIREGYRKKTGDTVIPDVAVFDGELSESAKTAFKQFKRAVAAIDSRNNSKKGIKAGLNFVLLKESPVLSGAILRKGNTLYMTADRLTDGTWAKTLVHEVIHFSEGSEAYRSLMNSLAKDNAAVARAIEAIAGEGSRYDYTAEDVESLIEKLEAEEDLNESEQDLLDELNAHLAEEILGNERMIERIVRQDKSFAERILSRIKELAEAFRSLGNKEARAEYKRLKQAEKLFMQAIENAGYKYVDGKIEELVGEDVNENVDDVNENVNAEADSEEENVEFQLKETDLVNFDRKSESISPVQFSYKTWTNSEYVTQKKETAKAISESIGVSVEKATAYINSVNSIAKMIANDRARLDYVASNFGSAFVSNVEYGGSFDYTTLCKKRRVFTGTFSEIQRILKNNALTADEILEIRNMLIDAGYEATCGLCYVEGSRASMGKFAKEFIRLYKRDNPSGWIPTMADVNTPDGVEAMQINHPEAYEKYEYFWNHYGKLQDSDPALFASQQKPKLYEARKEYKGEILDAFSKDSNVGKKNRSGGIRMQSFSDFEIVHMIDVMQTIMDMSRVGLAGQAYTKVPDFARVFGGTGLKINLSLIAKDVDENGKLVFDDREGMPHEEAFQLRNRYSKNVGTIIVVFTDAQLYAAMADSRIDFIIPFHRSQWKKGQYAAMGLPKGTKDYTFMQNEKLIKQTYHVYQGRMVKDKAKNYQPNEYWNFNISGKQNAEAYLEMCAKENKRPKFYKLLDYDGNGKYALKKDGSTDGYWKLLIDFKMYDNQGVGSPQMPVKPEFAMKDAKQILDEYTGGHQAYPVAYSVVDNFVEKYKENHGIQFSLKKTTSKKESPYDNAQTDSSIELAEETMRRRNFGDLDGVTLRKKANQENEKVYTKKDASEIVSEVLSEHMSFGEVYGTLRGKSREDVVDMLWRGLNAAEEGKRAGVALDVAEYIIRSAAVEDAVEDPANETHRETLDLLKQYVRKLDLSGIRAEINHKYDKKSARIYSRWGKRKDAKGLPPDVAAMELQELGFQIEATHPADILFEIEDAYQKASDALNTQAKAYLRDTMTNEEFKQKQQEIARDILKGFEEKGSKSRLAKTVNDYAERIANLKKELGEQKGRNSLENRVLDRLKKTKDLKLGTYHRSSEFNDARFRGSIERLASIQSRGVLREKKTREIFKELLSWYTAKNELLQGGQFSQEVYDMMEQIANGDGNLTNDDLRLMIKVVDYFNHFVETFNKVYRAGKYVDAEPLVKRYIKSIDKAKDTKISILRKWYESGYYQSFGDPLTLMRYADKYDPNGYYTELFLEFRRGAVGTATMQMQLMESYNQFFKDHKGYEKRLTEETLEYQGKKIPVDEAISLYMTTKRKQAWKAIVKSGVVIELDGTRVRFNPVLEGENVLTETELKAYADYVGKEIYRQMSETDRAFVGILENVMNNHCAILKRNTDMQRLGYTNVEAGAYYYPIVRAQIAKNLDSESFYDAMDHVSNLSINKNLVEGAQGELLIRPASAIFTRHVRQVSMYANLANALDNFNRLFNLNISDNPGKPITIQSQTSAVDFYRQMNEYVQKLVKDIQGLPVGATDQKWYNDKVRFVRSGFAKYQLGANPKVWVTQFSSFFAAQNILDFDSIVKGFSVKNKASDVDKYCLLAKLRNEENTVVRAQSVVDKTGKIGDILMKPIGMMDRFVVTSLFGACQVQVEKNGGAKVGTDQNMSEAAELLERVILETQQNALATERSGAMRSGDELLKSLTMFSADSMKVFGRFMDAAGELLTLKQNIKSNLLNNAEKATLEKRIQGARKQLMKSTATMVASAAFMALVGLMFRWLYRKDEDKDASEIAADVALDSIGNLIGGLPILRDVYSLFADGYELDNFLLTTLNDVVNATKSTVDLALDAATGKPVTSQEVASAIRKMVYSAGQIFGIPVRNAYNVVSGLIKRISPTTGYQIDNIFYQQSYNSDLAKAIENDDERMISTIAGLIIDEKVGTEDKATREALKVLTAEGFKVLPRSIGDKITYNEEEIELTKEQQNRFRTVYAASDQAVADLVKLDTFSQASAEEQAKAIRFIYDTYYNLARDDMLGVDSEQKNVLFAEAIPIEKLAIIAAVARSIEADKDKSGKAISGSKKAKVTSYVSKLKLTAAEKYMIMGYLGYTNVNGESQVKSYINRLNLSKNEKQLLLEYSGYKK